MRAPAGDERRERRFAGEPAGQTRRSRGSRSARRVNEPQPALVEAHLDGIPRSVNRMQVALVREEWRVLDRWWTEEPVDRRYFDCVLSTGENAGVFCDELLGGWFAQRA